jgi:imidazoleglycerol-phosphate dehydratase
MMRQADITRQTSETKIRVQLSIDGSGQHQIATGLGFFDHMLAQVAVHGLFDLTLEAQGDLEVDAHHTVEDCALVLGEAFNTALGDKKGIVRIASAFIPMDEALSRVVIDLSGRPFARVDVAWPGPAVAQLPTSLIEHFFQSFSVTCRCNLHAAVLYGRDNHHLAESLFKGLGRSLDVACQYDPRRAQQVPSSKGLL